MGGAAGGAEGGGVVVVFGEAEVGDFDGNGVGVRY
jgi:hypothetical protein